MKGTNFVYERGGALYVNLTNKCTNACSFCIRNNHDGVGGKELWLEREPSFEDVLEQLPKDISGYKEVVFCGFGEPTCNIEVLSRVGKHVKSLGKRTRVNTNGQANLYYGKDVTDYFVGAVDAVNVSLNASDATEYQKICKSRYGEKAFYAMLEFAALCQKKGLEVIMSVVEVIGAKEIAACKKLCEEKGLKLRVRTYE
jgi:TatD family-associated radical SAM protein